MVFKPLQLVQEDFELGKNTGFQSGFRFISALGERIAIVRVFQSGQP
jgi:hypothetical protein